MYIILSYDVNKIRCEKIMKLCRKYLFHKHNSVFEGELTEKEYKIFKAKLLSLINIQEDRIVIYKISSEKCIKREYLQTDNEIKCIY